MSRISRTTGRGFTIVELLIVIVVIGILAAISVTTANGIQKRSRTSAIYASAKQLATAVLVYGQSAGSFPNLSMSCFGDAALFPATATNNATRCWNIRQGATVWDQASVQSPTSMSSLLSTTISSGAMSYPVIELSDTDGYQHAVRGYWYTRSGSAPYTAASVSFAVPADDCPGSSVEWVTDYYVNGNICSTVIRDGSYSIGN